MLKNDRGCFPELFRNIAAQSKERGKQHHAQNRARHGNPRQADNQLSRQLETKKRCERWDQSPNPYRAAGLSTRSLCCVFASGA